MVFGSKPNSLRRNLFLILLATVIIPYLLLIGMTSQLYESQRASWQNEHADRLASIAGGVQEKLRHIELIGDLLHQAPQIISYVHAHPSIRYLTENPVTMRLAAQRDQEVDRMIYMIAPIDGQSIYYSKDASEAEIGLLQSGMQSIDIDGFEVVGNNSHLIFRKTLSYDDANMGSGRSIMRATLWILLPLQNLLRAGDNAIRIDSIPRTSTSDEVVVSDLNEAQSEPKMLRYLLGVSFLIFTGCVLYGIRIFSDRLLRPLQALYAHVRNRSAQSTELVGDVSEIDEIRVAFDQYVEREKVANEKLLEQREVAAVGRMAQMLAHDIRRPFSLVKMMFEVLNSTRDPQAIQQQVQTFTSHVSNVIVSVEAMLAELLDSTSPLRLVPERVSVNKLIESAVEEALAGLNHAGIQCIYEIPHDLEIEVDPLKMRRVFSNIIANAAQAMNGQGVIHFSAEIHQARLKIVIQNNGPVIPEDVLARIFQPFYTAGKVGGTGLGLAIAARIVREHGGQISCTSSDVDGTRFIIVI